MSEESRPLSATPETAGTARDPESSRAFLPLQDNARGSAPAFVNGKPAAAEQPIGFDVLDLLKSRRSIRPADLGPPGPSRPALDTMLTIAARVPDHGKLVPWRFIVFEGEGRLAAGEHIGAAFRADHPDAGLEACDAERMRLARAPLVVAVVSRAAPHVKIPEWEQVLSAGAAAMNLVLASHALGFAASWITEWYAFDRRVLDAFGLKPHERIVGFVHVGTPRRASADRPRPRLEDIVTRFNS